MLGIYNYALDSYGVLRRDFNHPRAEPNQNFLKVDYIIKNQEKCDSFIFGSSRAGRIDPEKIPSGRFYNMSYSDGLPKEHLENIKLFMKKGVKIKNLIIGLSDFSYLHFPEDHIDTPLRKPHYLVTGEKPIKFYVSYIFKRPSFVDIYHFFNNKRLSRFDIYGNGMNYSGLDKKEAKDNLAQYDNKTEFNEPVYIKAHIEKYHNLPGCIKDLKEIVEITNENNINLIIFIHPLYKVTYLNSDLKLFFYFLRELSEMTEFYDFSGLNPVTENNYYFYELTHFRPAVGDMIIARIFDLETVKVPDEFGVIVNMYNIDMHLLNKNNEIKYFKENNVSVFQ